MEGIAALPGVELVAYASELPMQFGLELGRNVRRLCHRVRQDGVTAGVRFPQRG